MAPPLYGDICISTILDTSNVDLPCSNVDVDVGIDRVRVDVEMREQIMYDMGS